MFACHPASGWHNQGSSNLKPQISILNSSRSTQPVAIARKGIRHTVHLTSDDRSETPPLRHFEWSKAESRNPPALRSLPLLSGKVFAAYHLSPRESVSHDSQVASAPLRIVFACHPASGWYNQGSSNLKPQVSNLKPLPLRPSGRSLHYTGREPERPGGHSFIPRTRAFHGNGDGRAEAIT